MSFSVQTWNGVKCFQASRVSNGSIFKGEKLAPKLEGAGFSTSCTKMCFKKPDASSKSFSHCESIFDFTPRAPNIYVPFAPRYPAQKNVDVDQSLLNISIVMSPSQSGTRHHLENLQRISWGFCFDKNPSTTCHWPTGETGHPVRHRFASSSGRRTRFFPLQPVLQDFQVNFPINH